MPKEGGFVETRRRRILAYIADHGEVQVSKLSEEFGVSDLTIRRDLNSLSADGQVDRAYGVARIRHNVNTYDLSNPQQNIVRIAQSAAKLIKDNETIFINTGTTALKTVEYITAKNITIVTNNGKIMHANFPSDATVLLTGGEIRFPKESITGELALETLSKIRADKAIMGCSGISTEFGLTTGVTHEMNVNRTMIERSDCRIVVADDTKIGRRANFQYASIDEVNVFVTNANADSHTQELIRMHESHSIQVLEV